ncbi:hypothetical protein [Deminuibacter soli]|nr:hypothetical protein [Deminuibacter soli]
MRKILPLLLTFFFSALLHSQAQVSFGLRGGVNFYNINGDDVNGAGLDYKLKTGFELGITAAASLGGEFLRSLVLYSSVKAAVDTIPPTSR